MTAPIGIAALLAALALAGAPAGARPGPTAAASAGTRAQAQIAGQAAAWNRGDLEAALATYCPSADIVWVNRNGVSHGFAPFAEMMNREFAGGPATMGQLENAVVNVLDLDRNRSLVTLRWSITRDGKRLMGGISSQIWAPCGGRMRVIFEHAS